MRVRTKTAHRGARRYRKPIGPEPYPIGPVQPVTFIPLDRSDDPGALARARAALANSERVVFDCGWDGSPGIALLGFEVKQRRDRTVVLIGHGYAGDYSTLEEAVRTAFLSSGSLE